MAESINILESFRDGIQGLKAFIPTETKAEILNSLLDVGYDFLDAGSFVSSQIIPQFRDMERVLDRINKPENGTRIFVLVGSEAGAKQALLHKAVDVVGFPFSTSETFLKKNINKGFEAAWSSVNKIQEECLRSGKELMVYLAMAFGNPYNDPVDADICLHWASKLHEIGVNYVHLSDIIGVATFDQVGNYYKVLTKEIPTLQTGLHLHVHRDDRIMHVREAHANGCTIFDSVINGLGGCPMTGFEMLHNLPTSILLEYLQSMKLTTGINQIKFNKSKILIGKKLAEYLLT